MQAVALVLLWGSIETPPIELLITMEIHSLRSLYHLSHSTGFPPVQNTDEAVRESGGGPCLSSDNEPGLKLALMVLGGKFGVGLYNIMLTPGEIFFNHQENSINYC
jgi:hypothetical protein